jgi:DNA-binding transcriptional ArsR family regulator
LTCKELLFFIDDQQKILEPSALGVLVHLITTGFRLGTKTLPGVADSVGLSVGIRSLAKRMGKAPDTVAKALRELADAHLITIERPHNSHIPKRYLMPAAWFTGEFTAASPPRSQPRAYREPSPWEVFN